MELFPNVLARKKLFYMDRNGAKRVSRIDTITIA